MRYSFVEVHPGDKVTGIVICVTSTEIQVDAGTKYAFYIPLSGLSNDPDVRVGDEIEAYVVWIDDEEGLAELSLRFPRYPLDRNSREICNVVRDEVLEEVRAQLSEMKPELVSSITAMAAREADQRYLDQIKHLESRIAKLERFINRTGGKIT